MRKNSDNEVDDSGEADLFLQLFHGTSVVNTGIIQYEYPHTTLVPVNKNTTVTSTAEIESLFYDPSDLNGDFSVGEIKDCLLQTFAEARVKLTGTKLYDPRDTDGLEPWDHNNSRATSLSAIRTIPIDAIAERGSLQYEIYDNITVRTSVHNLQFQGRFLGISPDTSSRRFIPCFVFSVDYIPYDQSEENSSLQSLVENEPETPLLYVPISDEVDLKIRTS